MPDSPATPLPDGRPSMSPIVRHRKHRFLDIFRKPTDEQFKWATERCPNPRYGGMHLEVMFQSRGVPYCGCPVCDAAFPGYRMPYNAQRRVHGA